MKSSYYSRVIRQFYKTTTLHGFKYLCSRYFYDRVCWVACCIASACCAGVLCAVLWSRFLQVPALLTLHDQRAHTAKMRLPLVAVCPTAETVAHFLQPKMSADLNISKRLPTVLEHVLKRKSPSQEQLEILEDILSENDLTLQEALMLLVSSCKKMVLNCRWQSKIIPCGKLFEKELTEWGACCVMRPEKYVGHIGDTNIPFAYLNVKLNMIRPSYFEETNKFHIAVQCSHNPDQNGCEFFTRYNGEDWVEPIPLTPGYNYVAQISFTSVEDKDSDKLVAGTCISTKEYTKRECLLKCREKFCGCADPIQRQKNLAKILPTCQVLQLKCLRTFTTMENNTCKCLPSCKKMTTYVSLESSLMNAVNETNDQIYTGLNVTTSSVLRIAVRLSGSRIFVVNPTETWITLLSSLGGVFNMFLGVGVFSALEGLFLVFVRLPIAIKKSAEMDNISTVGQ